MEKSALVLATLLLLTACGDGDLERRAAVEAAPTSRPSTSAVDVHVSDVVYDCGPADGPMISLRAWTSDSIAVVAELIVMGRPFGSSEVVVLGPDATVVAFGVSLNEAAYQSGTGQVRIRAADDEVVLAATDVRLRLPEGGCG